MIDATLYTEMLSKITETAKQRDALNQFIANGGRYKLSIESVENPEIAAMLTDIFKSTNAFETILKKATEYLNNKGTALTKTFLNEASTNAFAQELKEAAE